MGISCVSTFSETHFFSALVANLSFLFYISTSIFFLFSFSKGAFSEINVCSRPIILLFLESRPINLYK